MSILIDINRIQWCKVEEINPEGRDTIFFRKGKEGERKLLMNSNAIQQ